MPDDQREFYVGYLPMPGAMRRFLRRLIPMTLTALVLAMAAIAWEQRNPGAAVWNNSMPQKFSGVLYARPYPVLVTPDAETYLLVESGKHGAQTRSAPFDNTRVTVEGWLLERDARKIIELAPESSTITIDPQASTAPSRIPITPVPTFAPIVVSGEIVDAKCYLGAMKPGDGKGHKACATLCVGNGIPPMFVSRSGNETSYHLLMDAEGNPVNDMVAPYLGEPIELHPTLARWGSLDVFVIGRDSIKRP